MSKAFRSHWYEEGDFACNRHRRVCHGPPHEGAVQPAFGEASMERTTNAICVAKYKPVEDIGQVFINGVACIFSRTILGLRKTGLCIHVEG